MSLVRKFRILSDKDRENLAQIIADCLKPLELDIQISDNFNLTRCWMRSRSKEEEWEDYSYTIDARDGSKKLRLFESFGINVKIFDVGWHIAWQIFTDFGLDLQSETATTLWGSRKQLAKKYTDLNWS